MRETGDRRHNAPTAWRAALAACVLLVVSCGASSITISSSSNRASTAFTIASTTTYTVTINGGCGAPLTGILMGPGGPQVLPQTGDSVTLRAGSYTFRPDAAGCPPMTVMLTPS